MILTTIATGSSGNCYFLENDAKQILILDAGIPTQKIFSGINFRLKDVVGAVVTHEHKDHSLGASGLRKVGIALVEPYKSRTAPKITKVGNYTIVAFNLPHDGCENYGFLVKCDGESLVYLTDYEYCPVTFRQQRVNAFLIECNYIDEYVTEDSIKTNHVLRGHASLNTVKRIIQVNQTDALRRIILCHISRGNGDPDRMAAEVSEISHLPVFLAKPKQTIDLKG